MTRLRYSGIIQFTSKILGIVTGLLFTIIVTRRLTVEEFGEWQYITILFSYFVFPSNFVGFWLTRYISRGEKVGTTGLILNVIFSIPATIAFVLISIPASSVAEIRQMYFLFISPQIFLMYLSTMFDSIASGVKPQVIGYGSVIFELAKICFGAYFVFSLRLGLIGALASIEIAYAVQVVFMTVVLRKNLSTSFSKDIATKWLSLIWIPLLSSVSFQMQQLDSLIVTYVTRSTMPIAMLKAANVFSTIVSFSAYTASALYPRLLAGAGGDDMETSIRLVSLLAIPSMFGAIILADPLLAILRKEYIEASIVLKISVVTASMISITSVAEAAILATEKVDTFVKVNYRSYLRSKLALIPILGFVYDGVYLSTILIIVKYLSSIEAGPVEITTAISIIALIVSTPIVVYKWHLSKKMIPYKFPLRSVAIYLVSATVMSALILLLNPSDAVSTEIGKVIMKLIPKIAVGVATYFLLVTLLDEEPKIILKGVLRKVRRF